MLESRSVAFTCETVATTAEIQEDTIAGYGSCRSCSCTGYKKKKYPDNYCANCDHHFSQHR
jgi:hypothetical protein